MHCANPFCRLSSFFYNSCLLHSVKFPSDFVEHGKQNFSACLNKRLCASFMCTCPGRHLITVNNSPQADNMLFLIVFTYLIRFSLTHVSFPSTGWMFLSIMIKYSSCNKPFLLMIMSAFPIISTLLPVSNISYIFIGFISDFLFICL